MNKISFDIGWQDYSVETLAMVAGQDSFIYALFCDDYQLVKCEYFFHVDYESYDIDIISSILQPIDCQRKRITWSTKPYIHLPNTDYDLLNLYPSFDDKLVLSQKYTAQDVIVMYGKKSNQLRFEEEVLPDCKSFHISTILNNIMYPHSKKYLLAHFDKELLHLSSSNNENHKLYNQFRCFKNEDFLFYILLAYENLEFNLDSVPLFLSGRISKDSKTSGLLQSYVKKVKFLSSDHFQLPAKSSNDEQHQYFDLYATAICE